MEPSPRYVSTSGGHVAYSVAGSGPLDLVYVHGGWGHLDLRWEQPTFARLLKGLSGLGRLIQFDRRGTGLSDRGATPATLDEHIGDLRAVMEVVGATKPVIFGVADAAAVAIAHATSAPEQVEALILYAPVVKAAGNDEVPGFALPVDADPLIATAVERWGDPWLLDIMAPSRAADPAFVGWWKRYQQASVSPEAARVLLASLASIDVLDRLGKVDVPALVLHRSGDRMVPIANGRYVAEHIPGAVFKELPGDDYLVYASEVDAVIEAIAAFIGVARPPRRPAHEVSAGLSRREREVAGLVAEGLTNRQIATRLVISERTVESHVASVLRKLRMTSRSQVAAWAGRLETS